MVVSDGLCSKMPAIVEDEDEEGDEGLPADVITTFDEAIHCGNDVLAFLTMKGEEQLSESMFKRIQHLHNDKL